MMRQLLLSGALVAFAFSAAAREFRYGDILVRALPDLPQSTTHGYHEFPFQVSNESTRTRQVTLSGPDAVQTGVGMHRLRSLERTVTIGPRASVRLALLQPPMPVFGSGLRVTIDGRRQDEVIPWSSGHPEYWVGSVGRVASGTAGDRSRRVLISPSLTEQTFPPHKPEDYWVFRTSIPTSAWSSDWLAYSGYDGIVATAGDLAEAPESVVLALWQYVETGGALMVLGRPRPDSAWVRVGSRRPRSSREEVGMKVDYAGFGVAFEVEAARVTDLDIRQVERLEEAWRLSRKLWDRTRDPSGAHRQFAVSDRVEIPVRGLFLVVLAFTVLIGPVNLVILNRRGQRIWLLWTVPAASLLTCALVVLYVFAGEGLVRLGRTEGLTVLDEQMRRATTLGWTGFYASLTPGDGLSFDNNTEVSPVVSWQHGQKSGARTVVLGNRQHLSTGWLRARLPGYFILRKSEPRRERIQLRRRNGSLEAVNGLGVDLITLCVADDDGRLYRADGLLAGASVRLDAAGEEAAGGPDALRDLYRGDLPNLLLRLQQDPGRYLQPGTWLAVAEGSPFIEVGLEDLDSETSKAVIYGISQAALKS